MKKVFSILIAIVLLSSCETNEDISKQTTELKGERSKVFRELDSLEHKLSNLKFEYSNTLDSVDILKKEQKAFLSGSPQYILKLHLEQSHVSLNPATHIKDAMNAIDFELPVDPSFYNSIKVGDKIVDNFRTGSFIVNGSFGDWVMTVKSKEIR